MRLKDTPVSAVRIQPVRGRVAGNYRAIPSCVNEVKLYVKGAPKLQPYSRRRAWAAGRPDPKKFALRLEPIEMKLPELKRYKFRKMMSIDFWMLDGGIGAQVRKKDGTLEGCITAGGVPVAAGSEAADPPTAGQRRHSRS